MIKVWNRQATFFLFQAIFPLMKNQLHQVVKFAKFSTIRGNALLSRSNLNKFWPQKLVKQLVGDYTLKKRAITEPREFDKTGMPVGKNSFISSFKTS